VIIILITSQLPLVALAQEAQTAGCPQCEAVQKQSHSGYQNLKDFSPEIYGKSDTCLRTLGPNGVRIYECMQKFYQHFLDDSISEKKANEEISGCADLVPDSKDKAAAMGMATSIATKKIYDNVDKIVNKLKKHESLSASEQKILEEVMEPYKEQQKAQSELLKFVKDAPNILKGNGAAFDSKNQSWDLSHFNFSKLKKGSHELAALMVAYPDAAVALKKLYVDPPTPTRAVQIGDVVITPNYKATSPPSLAPRAITKSEFDKEAKNTLGNLGENAKGYLKSSAEYNTYRNSLHRVLKIFGGSTEPEKAMGTYADRVIQNQRDLVFNLGLDAAKTAPINAQVLAVMKESGSNIDQAGQKIDQFIKADYGVMIASGAVIVAVGGAVGSAALLASGGAITPEVASAIAAAAPSFVTSAGAGVGFMAGVAAVETLAQGATKTVSEGGDKFWCRLGANILENGIEGQTQNLQQAPMNVAFSLVAPFFGPVLSKLGLFSPKVTNLLARHAVGLVFAAGQAIDTPAALREKKQLYAQADALESQGQTQAARVARTTARQATLNAYWGPVTTAIFMSRPLVHDFMNIDPPKETEPRFEDHMYPPKDNGPPPATSGFAREPRITEGQLMHLAETAGTYKEFIGRLTTEFKPDAHSLTWSSDRGGSKTKAKSPQYFTLIDGATIAIAPDRFSEAIFARGDERILVHVMSDESGKPRLNEFRFKPNGVVESNDPKFHLSSHLLKELGPEGVAKMGREYDEHACMSCHLGTSRALFEADNHSRIFAPDKNWVFKDPAQKNSVEEKLNEKLKEFDTPENRKDPVYAWIFNQPQVVKRGYLVKEDLDTSGKAYRQMLLDTADATLGDLKRNQSWPQYSKAFEMAVNKDPGVDVELEKITGLDSKGLAQERERVEALQAQRNLSSIRNRNKYSIAYVFADGNKEKLADLRNTNSLKLNMHSIEAIGPKILDMVVPDREWDSLDNQQKARKIPWSELDVSSPQELKRLVSDPEVIDHIHKRVDAHIVLKSMLGSDTNAFQRLSTAIGANAESRGHGADLIENFADALKLRPIDQNQYSKTINPKSTLLVEGDLEKIYRQNPGLRTNTSDFATFESEAERILGDKKAAGNVMNFVKGNLNTFQAARSDIINKLIRDEPPKGRVVVSGQSVTGMVSAAIAAQSGYLVDGFDIREGFTRNIQWANRQAMVDELASIDPNLAKKFVSKITQLDSGYVVETPEGLRSGQDRPLGHTKPDPRAIPPAGLRVLLQKPGGIIETKILEDLLLSYVRNHPNIRVRTGSVAIKSFDPVTKSYTVTLQEKGSDGKLKSVETLNPDLLIVAEGSNSKTRDALGIKPVPASPKRFQVAGLIETPDGRKSITRRYRYDKMGKMISITMGNSDAKGLWTIADVDPSQIESSDPIDKQRKLEGEFRKIASQNLHVPVESIESYKVTGAFGNSRLVPFEMQTQISPTAAAGTNIVLLADSVGNFHWSAGGGATIGAVSHNERLKTYFTDLNRGVPKDVAIAKYSQGAIADSNAWGEISLFDFYDHMTQDQGRKAYKMAVAAYQAGQVESPLQALEIMFPEGRSTTKVSEQIISFPARLNQWLWEKNKK